MSCKLDIVCYYDGIFLTSLLNFCEAVHGLNNINHYEPIYSAVQGIKLVPLRFLPDEVLQQ